MSLAEERMRVLTMIENGQVSAVEGARLLDALGTGEDSRTSADTGWAGRMKTPRRLRVRVTDLETGQRKIDISLPWSLVSVGMGLGARFTPPEVDVDMGELMRNLEAGREGKVMDVVDDDDRERVEIFVE
jgi:SHOCT-like domain